ncbi:prolyl hydroxylase family protein [Aquimarina megaterium]|uniref:prolyl hydroxylase family protein n=1 Tax=Aquimarina megaterium TaxID=1443666 RepID=UPI000470698F|nr:2OG-Fe(II) oxygenase [Aquimarina megaterium]
MKQSVAEILEKDKIICIDGFVPASMCAKILEELEYSFWKRSTVIDPRIHKSHLSNTRISKSADQELFTDTLIGVIKKIEEDITSLFDVEPNRLEQWQATKYAKHGKFDYHYDSGAWGEHYAGERKKTYLLYLNTPKKGGATHFKNLDIKVKPKQGRLLVWDNLLPDGNCNYNMLHAGLPIINGKKTTLVTWERQKAIR